MAKPAGETSFSPWNDHRLGVDLHFQTNPNMIYNAIYIYIIHMFIPFYPHQILIISPLYPRDILNWCQAPMAMAMHMAADWDVWPSLEVHLKLLVKPHITGVCVHATYNWGMWSGYCPLSIAATGTQSSSTVWRFVNPSSEHIITSERLYYGSWIMMACGTTKTCGLFSHLWRFRGRRFGLNHLK